jgi:hypothetical protein
MRAFIFLIASMLVAAGVCAETLAGSNGADNVRLTDQPCASEVILGLLPEPLRADFSAGVAVVDGQSWVVCWRPAGASVHLLYEDGDQGLIPRRDLKVEISV